MIICHLSPFFGAGEVTEYRGFPVTRQTNKLAFFIEYHQPSIGQRVEFNHILAWFGSFPDNRFQFGQHKADAVFRLNWLLAAIKVDY